MLRSDLLIKFLELFNTFTAPFGFLLTIFTFLTARKTRKKLEEAQEISLFDQEKDYYIGQMEAIKIVIDSIEDRESMIPENVFIQLIKIMSKFEHNFPFLAKNNKPIVESINKFNKIKYEKEIKYLDFIDVFYEIENMFSNRKGLK